MLAPFKNDAALTALIGQRVYDQPPANVDFPYISFGPVQPVNEEDACHDVQDVFVQLNIWSRKTGSVEAKRIADAVCVVLATDLEPVGFEVFTQRIESVRHTREGDGKTSRAIVNLRLSVGAT